MAGGNGDGDTRYTLSRFPLLKFRPPGAIMPSGDGLRHVS